MKDKQIGRYTIIQELGRGGMAIVYRAYDPYFERNVAVKVLSEPLMGDSEFRTRFRQEARTMALLEHPAIVPVYDFGQEGNQLYIVMRYMGGKSLKDRLKNGPMPLSEVRDILMRLAGALDRLHENNMIHRDIKPANVLFDKENKAYLADFGIASIVVSDTVTFAGTLKYMAPEQLEGKGLDARSDIYSLAVMIFEMITGDVPPRSISVLNHPALPHDCDRVLARALAYAKEERYSTASEFASAFALAIEPKGIWDQLWKFLNRLLGLQPSTKAEPPINYAPALSQSNWSDDTAGEESYDEFSTLKPTDPRRIFICYQHGISEDQQLANYLFDFLSDKGYRVLMDDSRLENTQSMTKIEQQLQENDLLVVLLSQQSADNDTLQAKVRLAYGDGKLGVGPRILPVRIAYRGHSAIDELLDPQQYVLWQSVADNQRVAEQVLAAIQGDLPQQAPIKLESWPTGVMLSEDGRVMSNKNTWPAPLPKADPRFLQELSTPGAAVTLRDTLYVERDADAELKRNLLKMGSLTTIRAPHQTGKTSLFMRGIHHAHQHGSQVVELDMQRVDRQKLQTYDDFLRYLANYITWKLRIELDVAQLWDGPLGSQDKLSILLEDYVLSSAEKPLLLAIDEADRLLKTDFHTDFFALLRSWHDSASYQDAWRKLNLLLVISTEPHLLITDVNQSPFNVGLRLNLQDFNESQVRQLNQRHGSPIPEAQIAELMTLLNGQPYLTRQALYTLVKQPSLTWSDLKRIAATEEGPFASHLRNYHRLIHNDKNFKMALKQVIEQNQCRDEITFYRLRRAGLLKGTRKACAYRGELYRIYFEDKL